jgi:hypothetical protein
MRLGTGERDTAYPVLIARIHERQQARERAGHCGDVRVAAAAIVATVACSSR